MLELLEELDELLELDEFNDDKLETEDGELFENVENELILEDELDTLETEDLLETLETEELDDDKLDLLDIDDKLEMLLGSLNEDLLDTDETLERDEEDDACSVSAKYTLLAVYVPWLMAFSDTNSLIVPPFVRFPFPPVVVTVDPRA